MAVEELICPEITQLGGLLVYKADWGLSLTGWLLLLSVLVLVSGLIIIKIQPFLAMEQPIEADTLLVEGWISDEAVKMAIAEFERGNYQLLITTGPPLTKGHFLSSYKTFAELTAATLITLGFDPQKIITIPSPIATKNRTYEAALAVRHWLLNSNYSIQAINLFSYDVHTRRSWLLYRRVLSPEFKVGAIAYPSQIYDPQYWWNSSAGIRTLLPEAIAYLYYKLLPFTWKDF